MSWARKERVGARQSATARMAWTKEATVGYGTSAATTRTFASEETPGNACADELHSDAADLHATPAQGAGFVTTPQSC